MSPHVRAHFSQLGKKGVGASKTRSAEHYARLTLLGVKAREKKRLAAIATVAVEKKSEV